MHTFYCLINLVDWAAELAVLKISQQAQVLAQQGIFKIGNCRLDRGDFGLSSFFTF